MKFEDKVKILREKKYKGRETEELLSDIKRMTEGEELEYLLGEVLFCGAKVDLSLRPMIPRKETEFWVKEAISIIQHCESKYVLRVLDLFSGSGALGLSVLKNVNEASVDFIELDPRLKEQVEISVVKNNIRRTRARILTGDTWTGAQGKYDYIFAVPPYVPPELKEEIMKELKAESPLSFFDKEDGFYYHKETLSRAKDFLASDGTLFLEFDITQREKIEELAKGYGYNSISFLQDPYGRECTLIARP